MQDLGFPSAQVEDAFRLESQGTVDLFKIETFGTTQIVLYITGHETVYYDGNTWETLPCNLSEHSMKSTGEFSRPKFSVANPEAIFSSYIEAGVMDNAVVSRYRVGLPDLKANRTNHILQSWVVSRVAMFNKNMAVFELRSPMDGHNFTLPARRFYPPEFPHVSLR